MQSNEIRHNSAINMMTVSVASTFPKIPERLIQTKFKMIYCAKGNWPDHHLQNLNINIQAYLQSMKSLI